MAPGPPTVLPPGEGSSLGPSSNSNGPETQHQCCGVPMKYLSLASLTVQNALEGITVRYSRNRPGRLYILSTATVVVEFVKLAASVVILLAEERSVKKGTACVNSNDIVQKHMFQIAEHSLIYLLNQELER